MKSKTTVIREEEMPTQDDEQSQGARVAVLRNDVKHLNETLNRVEAKLDKMALNYVTNAQMVVAQKQDDNKHTELDKRIDELENSQTWIYRLVIAIVITAVLGMVLRGNNVI